MKDAKEPKRRAYMRFGTDTPGAMAECGKVYLHRENSKGHIRSNLTLTLDAETWLPFAAEEQEK
ncbi:hypothetical protein C1N60_02515 [Pantoea sp. SGAir0184]